MDQSAEKGTLLRAFLKNGTDQTRCAGGDCLRISNVPQCKCYTHSFAAPHFLLVAFIVFESEPLTVRPSTHLTHLKSHISRQGRLFSWHVKAVRRLFVLAEEEKIRQRGKLSSSSLICLLLASSRDDVACRRFTPLWTTNWGVRRERLCGVARCVLPRNALVLRHRPPLCHGGSQPDTQSSRLTRVPAAGSSRWRGIGCCSGGVVYACCVVVATLLGTS